MRPLPPTLVVAAALSLFVPGCGGDQPNVEADVAEDVAEGLAQRADAVAEALAQGDGCLALERTTELQSATAGARDAGEISDEVAAEVLTAAQRITDGTSCEPPPGNGEEDEDRGDDRDDDDDDDRGDDDEDDEDDDDDDRGPPEGRGRGRGNSNGPGRSDD